MFSKQQIKQKKSNDSIFQKQKVKNEFCFQRKDQVLRKFNLKNIESNIEQLKSQTMNKKHFSEKQKIDFMNKQSNLLYRIKHKKIIVRDLKNKIIGGGCGSSREIYNPQQINFSEKKIDLDDEFNQKYEKFTNKINICKEIENESQGAAQVEIIKCLKQYETRIRRNVIIYKPRVIELIDVYLIYSLTGSSSKELLKQDEIIKIGSKLKKMKESFEIESHENPTCDLIFYFDILGRFNSTWTGKDVQNTRQLTEAAEFITSIIKLGSGNTKSQGENSIERFDLKGVRSLLNIYQQQKSNQLFTYLMDIWVRKKDQFQDRILNLTLLEELQFNITIFNELSSKNNNETDLVILTLIKIDHYFSLAVKDQDNLKTLSQELSLKCEFIKVFLQLLIQKSDSKSFWDEMKSFLKFTVENHTYRFLIISILLNYNKIIQNTNDSFDYKEQIMEYLCYKYLCEKDKSVKLAFETNREFVDHFNSKIEKEEFKDKIIQLSSERNRILKIFDLEKYEDKIENAQDIERMIANRIIEKWERDVKRRQQDNIAQKDDVLLEVQDLYIEQSITYLIGNKILQPKKQSAQIDMKNKSHQRSNALQDILNNFLQSSIKTQVNQNVNIPITLEQDRCKIIGILAEGGTGKSMLIKKLETHLIQLANSHSEKENYIPLLIKCNSLDPSNPSIENYLLSQGVNKQQINSIKKSDRNKVILLDGYDEFTGEYFRVYSQLSLNEWKNTKVIVTSRKEKLELNDACFKFSLDDNDGLRDETSFCIVKLEEFTHENILQYCKIYFRKYRTKDEKCDEPQCKIDLDVMIDCMKNPQLEILLYLPINLYLFTRIIVQVKDHTEINKIKENISDQIGIQEIFFSDQFEREAQSFIDSHVDSIDLKKDKKLKISIKNCYFEYFQTIAIQMFKNRGVVHGNFLQLRRSSINFNIPQSMIQTLKQPSIANFLLDKIKSYINSKIITRVKSEEHQKINQSIDKSKEFIEFKHKSLFEYFVARGMKNDFDDYGEDIYKIKLEILEQFKINQKLIMNSGQNQSEQQILLKLYKLIKNQIESEEFSLNYHYNLIEKNNRYIQYLKRSQIQAITEISKIDIGASNLISALFISNFSFCKLNLRLCSFSKAYINTHKSIEINFDRCNFQDAFLQNSQINFDSCNTQKASIDALIKVFDTADIYSFKKVLWGKNNILYTISQNGQINTFTITNQNVSLLKSKQLSQSSPLNDIRFVNDSQILVSSIHTLFSINSDTLEIYKIHKFTEPIYNITLVEENILVLNRFQFFLMGTFEDGFQQLNQIGNAHGCAYNQIHKILVTFKKKTFYIWNKLKNFELIKTIKEEYSIKSITFSADGKYFAMGSNLKTCKIWNVEKDFDLIKIIEEPKSDISIVTFSPEGKYFATVFDDENCKIWNVERDFELINTIEGHTKEITSLAFSSDGKYLATVAYNNSCIIWDTEKDFEFTNTIQGHTNYICSVAFSADGKYLATGSDDNTCKIWNAQKDFQLIITIKEHTDNVSSVAFSLDGKYFATGSDDKTCNIWDIEKDFQLIFTISGFDHGITSIAFSADGKYFATGSSNSCEGILKLFNIEKDFNLFFSQKIHYESLTSVVFSTDGRYLLSSSRDGTCKIWNVEKGFELDNKQLVDTQQINSVAFSVDGKHVATGSGSPSSGTIKIWNAEKDFFLIKTFQAHTQYITSVAFSTNGKYLASGSYDCTCKIWNVDKDFELFNIIQEHTDTIMSVCFSADSKYLATGSQDLACKIWNVEQGYEIINSIQGHTNYINSAAFSANGKYLATGSEDKTFKIWNAEKGFELINTILGHTKKINSIAFSNDSKYLATGSEDLTCKIWNTEKGYELINTIRGHEYEIHYVAFSADGKQIGTCSFVACKIWNVEKGVELFNIIQKESAFVYSIAFSQNGKYFASCTNYCQIYNAEKGFEFINEMDEHSRSIRSVVFSSDSQYLATGSEDKQFTIWNVEKGFELIKKIKEHDYYIQSIAFSADCKYLATGSRDHTCKIWNVEKDFELINTIQVHTGDVSSVTFSEDGKYLATSSHDRTCKIWNAEKILRNQSLQQKIKQKNSFQENQSDDYQKISILDNIYIL